MWRGRTSPSRRLETQVARPHGEKYEKFSSISRRHGARRRMLEDEESVFSLKRFELVLLLEKNQKFFTFGSLCLLCWSSGVTLRTMESDSAHESVAYPSGREDSHGARPGRLWFASSKIHFSPQLHVEDENSHFFFTNVVDQLVLPDDRTYAGTKQKLGRPYGDRSEG